MKRAHAIAKLKAYLEKPEHRTIEERAPLLILKNGRRLMIEECFGRYTVSLDHGCTCRELLRTDSLERVLDVVLEQGAMRADQPQRESPSEARA